MNLIPAVNIVAVFHLASVAALVGIILTETVIELLPLLQKDLHRSTIRFHVWIDLCLELPVALVVIGTGVAMAFLVDNLTTLHIIKIGCASGALLLGLTCILRVLRRNILLKNGEPEEVLEKKSRLIHATAALIYLLMITSLVIGAWLAYNRVLNSIYS